MAKKFDSPKFDGDFKAMLDELYKIPPATRPDKREARLKRERKYSKRYDLHSADPSLQNVIETALNNPMKYISFSAHCGYRRTAQTSKTITGKNPLAIDLRVCYDSSEGSSDDSWEKEAFDENLESRDEDSAPDSPHEYDIDDIDDIALDTDEEFGKLFQLKKNVPKKPKKHQLLKPIIFSTFHGNEKHDFNSEFLDSLCGSILHDFVVLEPNQEDQYTPIESIRIKGPQKILEPLMGFQKEKYEKIINPKFSNEPQGTSKNSNAEPKPNYDSSSDDFQKPSQSQIASYPHKRSSQKPVPRSPKTSQKYASQKPLSQTVSPCKNSSQPARPIVISLLDDDADRRIEKKKRKREKREKRKKAAERSHRKKRKSNQQTEPEQTLQIQTLATLSTTENIAEFTLKTVQFQDKDQGFSDQTLLKTWKKNLSEQEFVEKVLLKADRITLPELQRDRKSVV